MPSSDDDEPERIDGGALIQRFRRALEAAVRARKPGISAGTLTSYVSQLATLQRKVAPLLPGKGPPLAPSLGFYETHAAAILQYVTERVASLQSRRSALSALYALTGNAAFQSGIRPLAEEIQAVADENLYSDRQRANLISFDAVKQRVAALRAELQAHPVPELYMDFLLLALMSGVYVTARRNEWGMVKLRNYDRAKDNFYKNGVFTFNVYKTASKFGQQTVAVPQELKLIVNRWSKLNSSEWMFYNKAGKPLDSGAVTKALTRIFGGKHIGCDMLRHISTTAEYQNGMVTVAALRERAEQAGHSLEQELQYVKH